MYQRWGKRLFDVLAAAAAGVVLSPVMAIAALAIRLDDRGPAIFRQERVGKDGRRFSIVKFRSMPVNAGELESADAGELPLTRVGGFLRRWSIDELPQLANVLRGDMSIVGPRPPLPSQTELIAFRAANGSMSLRPGITGLAQINGYDGMPNDEKARWDAEYAARVSLRTDLGIVARTLRYFGAPPPRY